jgi:hypothetical protein
MQRHHEISYVDGVSHPEREMDSKGEKTTLVLSLAMQFENNFQCRPIMRSSYGSGGILNFMHE